MSVTSKFVSGYSHYHVSMISHLGVSGSIQFHELLSNVNIVPINKEASKALFASCYKVIDCNLLYKRMGHLTIHALKLIMNQLNSKFVMTKNLKPDFCNACQFGKSHMQHFPSLETTTTQALELLHADLWGPAPLLFSQGYQYYISFLDDYTKFTWIFPLIAKSQALQIFTDFKHMVENKFNTKIKCLQIDYGGEFRPFVSYLASKLDIISHTFIIKMVELRENIDI